MGGRLLASVLALGAVAVTPAVAAARLPGVLTQQSQKHPFSVRPATISYTGDGTGIVGGPDGTSVDHPGRISWPTYTSRGAVGTGKVWLNDCEPSCADGTFSAVPVRLHAFSPSHGRFRRLTLQYTFAGKPYTDRRVIRHSGRFWIYDVVHSR